jgi:hypothetical protein
MPPINQKQAVPLTTDAPYKIGIYWVKSRWNGRQTLPVIISLQNGFFSMKTDQETIFSVPCGSVSVNFTKNGGVHCLIDNKKYVFYGWGTAISKSFSKEQLAELNQPNNTAIDMKIGLSSQGAGLLTQGAAGVGAGSTVAAVSEAMALYKGSKQVEELSEAMKRYGVQLNGKPVKPVKFILALFLGGIGIAIFLLIVTVIIAMIFSHK